MIFFVKKRYFFSAFSDRIIHFILQRQKSIESYQIALDDLAEKEKKEDLKKEKEKEINENYLQHKVRDQLMKTSFYKTKYSCC